jgi:phosphohistidine phosphatase
MLMYLVRHARAVDEEPGLVDEHRYLSSEGRRVARAVGRMLRERGVEVDAIGASPLVRAMQTAELFAEALDHLGEVVTVPALAPGFPVRLAAEMARGLGERVLLVGHEPSISGLGAHLCNRPSFPQFRTSQVALVERGEPRWLLNPDSMSVEPLLLA